MTIDQKRTRRKLHNEYHSFCSFRSFSSDRTIRSDLRAVSKIVCHFLRFPKLVKSDILMYISMYLLSDVENLRLYLVPDQEFNKIFLSSIVLLLSVDILIFDLQPHFGHILPITPITPKSTNNCVQTPTDNMIEHSHKTATLSFLFNGQ